MDGWMGGQRDERKISIMSVKKKTIITQKCSCSVITACLISPPKKMSGSLDGNTCVTETLEFIDVL